MYLLDHVRKVFLSVEEPEVQELDTYETLSSIGTEELEDPDELTLGSPHEMEDSFDNGEESQPEIDVPAPNILEEGSRSLCEIDPEHVRLVYLELEQNYEILALSPLGEEQIYADIPVLDESL